jgi:hypothetical protein
MRSSRSRIGSTVSARKIGSTSWTRKDSGRRARILANKRLFVNALAFATLLYALEPECSDLHGAQAEGPKATAERMFVAYTEGKVKSYKVFDPRLCGEKLYIVIDDTSKNRPIGSSWFVTIDRSTQTVSVRSAEE